jgi:hypothetical protein
MSTTTNYFIGKGALQVADNDASGVAGPLADAGEVMISYEIEKEYKENYSTRNELNELDAKVPVRQSVKGTISCKETTAQNLELYLHGKKTVLAGGPVTGQNFPAGVQAGESYQLPGFAGKVSALTIKDSAGGGGASLVLGTHYTVDLTYGRVKFLDVTGFTQPFKASFTNAAATRNSILTKRAVNKRLRLEGINVGNNDGARRFVDELYNVTVEPAKKIDAKGGDEYANYEMAFTCVVDPKASPDEEFGRYGNRLTLE